MSVIWRLTYGHFTSGNCQLNLLTAELAKINFIFVHIRHVPSDKKLEYFKFWCKWYKMQSTQDSSISNALIKALLRTIIVSMAPVLQAHIVNQLGSTDFAMILAIGWSQMTKCNPNKTQILLTSMNNDVAIYLDKCDDARTYYRLVNED